MLVLNVEIVVFILLGLILWISPREYRLIDCGLPWGRRLIYTVLWPLYLARQRTSYFIKILGLGLMCAVVSATATDLSRTKSYSLRASEIREIVVSEQIDPSRSFSEVLRMELADGYCAEALSDPDPRRLIQLVDTPAEAAFAIFAYTARNGIAVSDTPPDMSQIHQGRMPIDCYGAAVIAAALLADDGYGTQLLSLRTSPRTFLLDMTQSSVHMVYVYKHQGKLGYVSLQQTTLPIFDSLDLLIDDVSASMKVEYTQYFLFRLEDIAPDFLHTNPGTVGQEIWRNADHAGWWDYLN